MPTRPARATEWGATACELARRFHCPPRRLCGPPSATFGEAPLAHRLAYTTASFRRRRRLAALLERGRVEAVVALGALAENAWQMFLDAPEGAGAESLTFVRIRHPTQPEAAGGGAAAHAAAIKALLENWNQALETLHPLERPDKVKPLRRYGDAFKSGEKRPIPDFDTPPWAPGWMRVDDGWADRSGSGKVKWASILVRVPKAFLT